MGKETGLSGYPRIINESLSSGFRSFPDGFPYKLAMVHDDKE